MSSMAMFEGLSKLIRVMFSNAAAGAAGTVAGFYNDVVKIINHCQCSGNCRASYHSFIASWYKVGECYLYRQITLMAQSCDITV
jgi:hypothetical protein